MKGNSWMVENWRASGESSQRVGPEGCPPMDRQSDFHGPRPTLARHGRAETRCAGSWSQAASGSNSHFLPLQRTQGLSPCFVYCSVLFPGHPGYQGLVGGAQSAC